MGHYYRHAFAQRNSILTAPNSASDYSLTHMDLHLIHIVSAVFLEDTALLLKNQEN